MAEYEVRVYEAVDVDDDAGIRAWQCSMCSTVQPVESDPCHACRHPRDPAPASHDVIIPNWRPNEGELEVLDDGEDFDEQPEGAPPAMDSIDIGQMEGAAPNSDDGWSDEDPDSDWGMKEMDPADELASKPAEDLPPEGDLPIPGLERGWICSICTQENSILDMQCISCSKYRDVNADTVVRKAEVTAGERPNAEPEEKDLMITHEVWVCPGCTCVNDYDPNNLICFQCNHVVDSTRGELLSWGMGHEEYEQLIGGPRRKAQERRGGGGGGGGGAARAPAPARDVGHAARGGGRRNSRPEIRDMRGNDWTDNFKTTPPLVRRHTTPERYPMSNDLAFKNPNRLGTEVGNPTPLGFSKRKPFWRSGTIAYPCARLRDIQEERNMFGGIGVADRGFDVNEN